MAHTLYLLRHAKSSWSKPGLDDFDRPLNPRGKATRDFLVDWFADNGIRPDLVICSPAKRTRQTLKPIKALWDPRPEIVFEASVYEAELATLKNTLRHASSDHRSILLVGHNPGLQQLALDLMDNGSDAHSQSLRTKFPTGAIACLTTNGESWKRMQGGSFHLQEFVLPREQMAA